MAIKKMEKKMKTVFEKMKLTKYKWMEIFRKFVICFAEKIKASFKKEFSN